MRKRFGWIAWATLVGSGLLSVTDAGAQQPTPASKVVFCKSCGRLRRVEGKAVASAQQSTPGDDAWRWCSCVPKPSPQVTGGGPVPPSGPIGVPSGSAGAMPGGIVTGPGAMPGANANAPEAGTQAGGPGPAPTANGATAGPASPVGSDAALASGLGGGLGGSDGALVMLGDRGPAIGIAALRSPIPPTPPTPSPPPSPGQPHSPLGDLASKAKTVAPYVRGMKMAENMSPIPQDRIFSGFNYYNNVNGPLNGRFASPVSNIEVFRYLLGFEKTFFNGNASIGFRDDINTLTSTSRIPGLGGTSSSLGDLNLFLKFVLLRTGDLSNGPSLGVTGAGGPLGATGNGSLISTGLTVNTPTGPGNFAGSSHSESYRNTELGPFVGYFFKRDRLFVQGFEQISVPLDARDVVMLYSDIGVGYYLYRNNSPNAWITAIAPTFECHVNVPLTHRDYLNLRDPAGTPTAVDLTYGTNVLFGRRSLFTTGIVTPVTGPQPFTFEVVALFSYNFGPRARPAPPIIGQ